MQQDFRGPIGYLHRAMMATANAVSRPEFPLRRWLSPLYTHLLFLLGGGGVPGEINGETYRLDPRYRWRLWPDYEAELASYLRDRVRPGQLCVDVGANIGVYVLQIARWTAPAGRIVAFEPNAATFAVLRRHVRINGLSSRVTLERMAVGRSAGTVQLFDTNPGSGLSRIGAANPAIVGPADSRDVPMTTLDQYFRSADRVPDWILIDVEGYEFDALAGGSDIIRRGANVIVEMHPHLWPGGEVTRAEGERLLAALGRRLVPISGHGDPWAVGIAALEPVN